MQFFALFMSILAMNLPWYVLAHKYQDITARRNTCRREDRTYSPEVPRNGSYQPWIQIPLESIVFPAKQYVTIVNLTPHRFVLDRNATHSYQMDVFDWGDIPQGRSRQNIAEYTKKIGKNAAYDAGEAYYTIQGTSKKFVVRKTAHISDNYPRRTIFDLSGMGLGQREYSDPGKETAVTLVVTGSDSYGFIASLRHGPGNWMKKIYNTIKDRQVQHLFLPGSHDAGMSRISRKLDSVGSTRNTQTQGITIYDQLRVGSRLLDLRIGTIHDVLNTIEYDYWTLHVSDENAEVAVGNTGESLDDVVGEINQFSAESPGEIIFVRVRYLVGIRSLPGGGPIPWTEDIMNKFFDRLRAVNNRCGNLDLNTKFNKQKASYFMDQNGGKGCVIFLLDTFNVKKDGVPRNSSADGIYDSKMLDVVENWSNMADTAKVANDQTAKWKTVSRNGSFATDSFFLAQWIISTDFITTTALSIEEIAVQPTNPALYWMGVNHLSPETFPTVLLIDYIGVVVDGRHKWDQLSAEMYTLAVGMNLYMISENCDINNQPSPLLPQSQGGSCVTPAREWNGIIYENGTVIDSPPDNFHLGRAEILKSGTVFLNGTVITHDIKGWMN